MPLIKYFCTNGYIYHDMLFYNDLLNENLKERFIKADIYDVVVFDWWAYTGYGEIFRYKADKVNNLFRSVGKPITGYFHFSMPTQMNENIYAMTSIVKKHNFEGMIAYSSFEYCYDYNYNLFAQCAWNPDDELDTPKCLKNYAIANFPENTIEALEALKLVQEFTNGKNTADEAYLETLFDFYNNSYLSKVNGYPQDYPARQFREIRDNELKYLPYLKSVLNKSEYAYNIFSKNDGSDKADIWKLICATFNTLADEFYSIYTASNALNEGKMNPWDFIDELNRLILQRERTIALLEDVRIEANVYIVARNMSICREFMIDLRDNIKAQILSGKRVVADIYNFGEILSDISKFLR